jgi:hypothetical protein
MFYAPRLFTWPPRLSLKIGGAIFKFNGDYTEATGQGNYIQCDCRGERAK